ncbi:MAG: hypothetical protein CME59_03315 [Halioglobus sp.]|nr:hypothetical protein [Halioglobus sp.]
MDVVLITLGVLGIGAIIVSAYVFMVAARNYVSDETAPRGPDGHPLRQRVERGGDRRSGEAVSFPLMVNGILIEKDRRVLPDRRQGSPA